MNIQNWRTDLIESELTDKAKLVGLVLSVYWNSRNKIYPSLTTLENDCSLTKNTIIKAIEELKGGNFVIVNKEHHRKSSYMVNTYTLTGVTTAPMNALVNDTVNEQANDRANDSVASAPMNAPELGIRELDIKKDTKVSKKCFGENFKVLLKDEEYQKLVATFGETATKDKIQNLENYILSKGKKYASHYHTLLMWERKNEPEKKSKIEIDNLFGEKE